MLHVSPARHKGLKRPIAAGVILNDGKGLYISFSINLERHLDLQE